MSEHTTCPAALNIKGEHFPCDFMERMAPGSTDHTGWAHSNRDAEAIWTDDPAAIHEAWAGARGVGKMSEHDCETCETCLHNGNKCCGCYDGACCQESR